MSDKLKEDLIMEVSSINIENEKSLHAGLKRWYSKAGDRFEVKVDGCIIDILRDDLLIEIQTKNFSAISNKLRKLVKNHKVRLIYPIPAKKYIVTIDEKKTVRRKSPKKGSIYDVFKELIRITDLIANENFEAEILLIEEEEIRVNDGKGSWRRKGISIDDRKLVNVRESIILCGKDNYKNLLPLDLGEPFTNKSLSKKLKISISNAQKMTYCLRKAGVLHILGKNGNELLFELD
ncbi:hypothetical protein OXPF_40830 [Oxobacter pfennigii]|uniref:DUF8091 domain-containing protein n=1 Tax=Oxobacter pfennigii TaxID=36849 RepID=A0A0P8W3W4_9CLOT|nr:hypothetical protein [Oxobacter pfennigii]KPU42298.1 hypothetical protein OXPF_40830 [Oxobacter pfennigii]